MTDLPDILKLNEVGERQYHVVQPTTSAEGRDVVFSGQLLAQMMMGADRAGDGSKDVRSVHAVFARAGTYTLPIELSVESMQAGRTWASDTVTARQADRLLSRSIVLMNTVDADLIRHEPNPPDVPGPQELEIGAGQAFPGTELRPVGGEREHDGSPADYVWHRFEPSVGPQVAHQAILSWATCGDIIGVAMRPHRDTVDISQAHRSLSTGVIAHTMHFLERFDVGDWLLIEHTATKAGSGRVYGRGRVFTIEGCLVATFEQDSMAKAAPAVLDPKRAM